jgi:ribosomal protein L7/L12
MQVHLWHFVLVAAIGFVLGRLTAPDPIRRERERTERAASLARNKRRFDESAFEGEVRDLLRRNQKIAAIARVRSALGIGLREAKDRVERIDGGARA